MEELVKKSAPPDSIEERAKKDLGSPFRVILTTLVLFFASQVVAALLVGVYIGVHIGAKISENLDQSAPIQFFYVLLAEGLSVWLVLKIVKRRGLSLPAIGLGRKPRWLDVKKALFGAAGVYLALISVSILIMLLFPSFDINQTQDVGFTHLNSGLDNLLAFVSLVIIPPLGEEILVRGYLYSGLRSRMKFVPAMLVTSGLFGLAHLTTGAGGAMIWLAAVDTFILSLMLVYLREKTGALWAGMLVHSLNNLVAFFVTFH